MIRHAFLSSVNLNSGTWATATSHEISQFKALFVNNSSLNKVQGFYIEEDRNDVEIAGVRNSTDVAGLEIDILPHIALGLAGF